MYLNSAAIGPLPSVTVQAVSSQLEDGAANDELMDAFITKSGPRLFQGLASREQIGPGGI